MSQRPILAITMGDPAGIGPEVIVKALADPEPYTLCRPLVVGDARTIEAAARTCGLALPVRAVEPHAVAGQHGVVEVLDLHNVDLERFRRGVVSVEGGQAAYECVVRAVELALAGVAGGVVTAPLNKEALHLAGHRYPGHTELLAHLCGVPDDEVTMLLAAPRLKVAHVSMHTSLRQAIELVRPERIARVVRLAERALVQMGVARPRIAVAGLNPHAGESRLFGDEDADHIAPTVAALRAEGLDVSGPLPPDTVFYRAYQGEFDVVVAMYHDQGHIPMKLVAFDEGVNVTLGLPIIRTSVDHGTAFDIAGTGKARADSMLAALRLGAAMVAGAARLRREGGDS
ncbi:MAG TPA: 4-hydroxythreonine-4-phosphate dehydrogenase PdxA [Chloroflexota bacterium]